MLWKGIVRDEMGRRYDVDQDFNLILSNPEISRDDSGRITRVVGDKKRLGRIARSLQQDGRQMRLAPGEAVTIDIRQHQLTQPIDADVKRLCVKMSVGTARRFDLPVALSSAAAEYLLEATVHDICPVRIVLDQYQELDRQRPCLGHLVYVRASAEERRIYSVVQFFGVMQFYCELADEWTGDDQAVLATHDPISHEEIIRPISPLNYAVPQRFAEQETYSKTWRERLERLRLELVAVYGDQAPLNLELNS